MDEGYAKTTKNPARRFWVCEVNGPVNPDDEDTFDRPEAAADRADELDRFDRIEAQRRILKEPF